MAVVGLRRPLAIPRVDRRTVIGAALAAAAALLMLVLTRPVPTVPVLVAAADLPRGAPLTAADVTVRQMPSAGGLVEGDDLGALSGWSLAAPVAAGEPLLPSLLRPPARAASPDLLALSLPETHAVLGTLAPGDLVDVLVTTGAGGLEPAATELLATDVLVVDARADGTAIGGEPRVDLLLAVDADLALALTQAMHGGDIDLVRVGP